MRLERVIEMLVAVYLWTLAAYFVSLGLRSIWLMWAG